MFQILLLFKFCLANTIWFWLKTIVKSRWTCELLLIQGIYLVWILLLFLLIEHKRETPYSLHTVGLRSNNLKSLSSFPCLQQFSEILWIHHHWNIISMILYKPTIFWFFVNDHEQTTKVPWIFLIYTYLNLLLADKLWN